MADYLVSLPKNRLFSLREDHKVGVGGVEVAGALGGLEGVEGGHERG